MHDGWKQGLTGNTKNTVHAHPIIATKTLRENIKVNTKEEKKFLEIICNNIEAHMGKWNTCKWDSTVLPVPKGNMQKFVHLADYLASRKSLEYNFEVRK